MNRIDQQKGIIITGLALVVLSAPLWILTFLGSLKTRTRGHIDFHGVFRRTGVAWYDSKTVKSSVVIAP